MDWWTFGGADASVASTSFGLRRARHLSCSPSNYSGLEIWVLHFGVLGASFRVLGASFSSLKCSVSEFWVFRFRDLGASFSRFGCFVLRSSFSSASFSKLPVKRVLFCVNYSRWFSAFETPGGSYMDALPVAQEFRVTWSQQRLLVSLLHYGSTSLSFFRDFSSLLLLLIVSFSNGAIVLNYIWY